MPSSRTARRAALGLAPTVLTGLILISLGAPASALPAPELRNPGFEAAFQGWSPNLVPGMAKYLQIDRTNPAEGKACLRISAPTPAIDPWLAQGIGGIEAGATYRVGARVRGQQGKPVRAAIKIEFYNQQTLNTSAYYGFAAPAPDGSWGTVEVSAPADADTVKAVVLVRLFGTGSVWFDDVRLTRTGEAPALTFMPPRVIVGANAASELRFQVNLPAPWGANELPELALKLFGPVTANRAAPAEPVVLTGNLVRTGGDLLSVIAQLPPLAPGTYQVVCGLKKVGDGKLPLFSVPSGPGPQALTASGRWTVGGKPFLPISLAHAMPADYAQIAGAGFNCVQGVPTLDEATVRQELDAAQAAGLKVILPLYPERRASTDVRVALQLASSVSANPALLGYELADEPDLTPAVAAQVAALYLGLRESKSAVPAVLPIARPAAYSWWSKLCDVLQAGAMPLPEKPAASVGEQLAAAREHLRPAQGLLAGLQAGWSSRTQPTVEQARLMMYLALIKGANGLVWYSLHDVEWDLTRTGLWEGLRGLNAEAASLAPALAGEPATDQVTVTPGDAPFAAFRDGDKLWLVVANPTAAAVQVHIQSRAPFTAAQAVRGSQKLEVSGGNSVELKIPGQGAEAVLLDLARAGLASG